MVRSTRLSILAVAAVGVLAAGGISLAVSSSSTSDQSVPPTDATAQTVADSNRPFPQADMRDVEAATHSNESVDGWPEPVVLAGVPLKIVRGHQDGVSCFVAGLREGNSVLCAPDSILQRDGFVQRDSYVGGSNVISGISPRGAHVRGFDGLLTDGRFFLLPAGADSVKSVTFIDDSGNVMKTHPVS